MWNLKRTYFQNRKRLIDLENKLMWEGIVREFGKVMYTCCIQNSKLISNKDILYSTWNSTQCYVPPWMKGGLERMDTCICMDESLHYSPETATTLLMDCIPIQNKKFKV